MNLLVMWLKYQQRLHNVAFLKAAQGPGIYSAGVM